MNVSAGAVPVTHGKPRGTYEMPQPQSRGGRRSSLEVSVSGAKAPIRMPDARCREVVDASSTKVGLPGLWQTVTQNNLCLVCEVFEKRGAPHRIIFSRAVHNSATGGIEITFRRGNHHGKAARGTSLVAERVTSPTAPSLLLTTKLRHPCAKTSLSTSLLQGDFAGDPRKISAQHFRYFVTSQQILDNVQLVDEPQKSRYPPVLAQAIDRITIAFSL